MGAVSATALVAAERGGLPSPQVRRILPHHPLPVKLACPATRASLRLPATPLPDLCSLAPRRPPCYNPPVASTAAAFAWACFWPSCPNLGPHKSIGRRSPSIPDYEIMFIVDPTLSDEEIEGIQQRLTEVATARGAEVKKISPWQRRRLAYEIKGRRDGIYLLAHMRGDPPAIKEVERQLAVMETVLRRLVIRLDEQ